MALVYVRYRDVASGALAVISTGEGAPHLVDATNLGPIAVGRAASVAEQVWLRGTA
jgi:hypothetical protein